jgi:hypothetical protein
MRVSNIITLLLGAVVAEQPDGVSNTIYDCTYDNTAAQYLDVNVAGDQTECGLIGGKSKKVWAGKLTAKKGSPTVVLNGAVDSDYYTVVLSNPDDSLGENTPVIHGMVVNVLGSELTSDAKWSSLNMPSD